MKLYWCALDEDTQQDMFDNSDEDEGGDEEGDTEDRWRAERHAREKFLEEQAVGEISKAAPHYKSATHPLYSKKST